MKKSKLLIDKNSIIQTQNKERQIQNHSVLNNEPNQSI